MLVRSVWCLHGGEFIRGGDRRLPQHIDCCALQGRKLRSRFKLVSSTCIQVGSLVCPGSIWICTAQHDAVVLFCVCVHGVFDVCIANLSNRPEGQGRAEQQQARCDVMYALKELLTLVGWDSHHCSYYQPSCMRHACHGLGCVVGGCSQPTMPAGPSRLPVTYYSGHILCERCCPD